MRSLKYYWPGFILIATAILIVAVPEILIALLAALIFMAGIGAFYLGHMIRKSEIEFRNIDGWYSDDDFYGWWFARDPIFRRWHP